MLCENYRIERFPYRALNNPFVMNIEIDRKKIKYDMECNAFY